MNSFIGDSNGSLDPSFETIVTLEQDPPAPQAAYHPNSNMAEQVFNITEVSPAWDYSSEKTKTTFFTMPPHNIQDNYQEYSDSDVLERSKHQWLNYEDVGEVLRSVEDLTVSVSHVPVEKFTEGLFLYNRWSVTDTVLWEGDIKKTKDNTPLRYTSSSVDLEPIQHGIKSTYHRRVYKHPEFPDYILAHYQLRHFSADAEPEDSGDDSQNSGYTEEDPIAPEV
ncbi:unnamed protein product [Microthlaspi erraticum]|uniref:Uncharacterized protein n=1 Tax=Microthlaspi erraticum TaxID=1685480 RepID=A0A6D2HHQ9_9BRAS|nr:unnamed protein product [Microthlaspi erraticum]